ncbi:MAG: hypothetical protein B7X08_02685 [Acidocella sp. 20-63-7]|nr:MAG: hypothetical protein B7X08_02685 [Acidocella sp. 20-63-7]HQT45725.1 thiamine phosphate synthase [Acidocella sp.]
MDQRLIAWGGQVKQRTRNNLPVLWLFTDAERLPNPLPAIAKLPNRPKGLCGVVFRHDSAPNRQSLGQRIAMLCKQRGVALVVAGDARLAASLRAGVHLRGGRWPGPARPLCGLRTASAHTLPEILRARRQGASIIFISPAFPTASHPGGKALGAPRWTALSRHAHPAKPYALGGISSLNLVLIGKSCHGIASINAMSRSI